MRALCPTVVAIVLAVLLMPVSAFGASEEEKQAAIDDGLAYLHSVASSAGAETYWTNPNNGNLAATASAALAFIEEGYLPGDGSAYDATVTGAVNYIMNRATVDGAGRLFFHPGNYDRSIYTTGIVAPVLYALGEARGKTATIGVGSGAIASKTYVGAMQEVMNWYTWGQNDPAHGVAYGGWGYRPNSGSSDNSTAQWGALPFLYGEDWGLTTPPSVTTGLEAWTNRIQHPQDGSWMQGGSGYSTNSNYVNMSKTGGMLLEFAVLGKDLTDADVQNALGFMNDFGHWTAGPSGTWYGNLGHPYAMWAVYKGLQQYGLMETDTNGILVGTDMPAAVSVMIGHEFDGDGNPLALYASAGDDWYSHYCDWLVNTGWHLSDGSWYNPTEGYWGRAMTTAWYINILNATGAPPGPVIPEPTTLVLLGAGIGGLAALRRRRTKQT